MLPEIVEAVRGTGVEVYMDGGVRLGTDVLKALALGARAVFVGRPVIWGLAYKVPHQCNIFCQTSANSFSGTKFFVSGELWYSVLVCFLTFNINICQCARGRHAIDGLRTNKRTMNTFILVRLLATELPAIVFCLRYTKEDVYPRLALPYNNWINYMAGSASGQDEARESSVLIGYLSAHFVPAKAQFFGIIFCRM